MWNDEANEKVGGSQRPGRLVVISGPSGSGKSTLVQRLLAHPELRLTVSVSATTRSPRPGEVPGHDYLFLTPDQFEQMRLGGDLLEYAPVHGHLYGTPAEPVRRAMAQGLCVALVIDVQGGFQVREKVSDALLVFIQVPSIEVLENRLRARGTDEEAVIERRLAAARRELERAPEYDVQVVNDELDRRCRKTRLDPDPEGMWGERAVLESGNVQPPRGETMIDELKEEEIVNKVGGRFKLSTLIQKRMIALNQGARPLVDMRGADKMSIVIQEIMQEKIYLDMSGKLQTVEPTEELEMGGETIDLTQPRE